ncbi:MAG: hypothetical protein RI956_745, partial [Pseudomonadota bacterium]
MQSLVKIYSILFSKKIIFSKYIGFTFLIEFLPAIFLSVLLHLITSTFD